MNFLFVSVCGNVVSVTVYCNMLPLSVSNGLSYQSSYRPSFHMAYVILVSHTLAMSKLIKQTQVKHACQQSSNAFLFPPLIVLWGKNYIYVQ